MRSSECLEKLKLYQYPPDTSTSVAGWVVFFFCTKGIGLSVSKKGQKRKKKNEKGTSFKHASNNISDPRRRDLRPVPPWPPGSMAAQPARKGVGKGSATSTAHQSSARTLDVSAYIVVEFYSPPRLAYTHAHPSLNPFSTYCTLHARVERAPFERHCRTVSVRLLAWPATLHGQTAAVSHRTSLGGDLGAHRAHVARAKAIGPRRRRRGDSGPLVGQEGDVSQDALLLGGRSSVWIHSVDARTCLDCKQQVHRFDFYSKRGGSTSSADLRSRTTSPSS